MAKSIVRNRKKSNKMSMFLIGFIMMIMCGIIVIQISDMRQKQRTLEQKEIFLQNQLAEEQQRTEELEQQKVYVQTKKYIEEKAKDLGYIYPDEIILKPQK